MTITTDDWIPTGRNNWAEVSVAMPNIRVNVKTKAEKLYKDLTEISSITAKLLYEDWGHKPLYLPLSGGIDSEYVANILLQNKIPFTPIILKIANFNEIECWYATYWCSKNNITPIILNLTVDEYVDSTRTNLKKLLSMRNIYQVPLITIFDHVEKLEGFCVPANGNNTILKPNNLFFSDSMDFVSGLLYPGKHPTEFFLYTPEIALSYVYQFDINLDNQYNKLNFYKINPRPKIDYYKIMVRDSEISTFYNRIYDLYKDGRKNKKLLGGSYYWGTKQETMDALFSENESVK